MKTKLLKSMGLWAALALMVLSGCSEAMSPEEESATYQTQDQELLGFLFCPRPARGENLRYAFTTDGKCIAYRVFGHGPQDVILVHGWSVSGDVYDNFIAQLDTNKYRVIVPDLRGTGRSDKPSTGYSLDNYQRDVMAVALDAGALRFVLVGHSMGGAIAQKIAAERPLRVKALVLMSPVPASGFPLPEEAYDLFWNSAHDPALQEIVFGLSSPDLTPQDMAHLLASAATVSPTAVQESLDAWTQADFAHKLKYIHQPVKVIVSDDPFLSAPILQDLVVDPIGCNADMSYFAGAGHYLQVEDASATADIFDDFVDQVGWGWWSWCN